MLTIDDNAIVYRETQLPWALRLFAIFLGLGTAIVIPAPFIIHADWETFSPMLLAMAVLMVFPFAFGCFMLRLGFVSAATLRLDPATGRADRELRGPFVNRRDSFRLSEIAPPKVVVREGAEDGPSTILQLRLPTGRRLDMACFVDQAEAELWRDRIAQVLSGHAPLQPSAGQSRM